MRLHVNYIEDNIHNFKHKSLGIECQLEVLDWAFERLYFNFFRVTFFETLLYISRTL